VALSANGADELFFGYVRIPTPNINNEIFKKRQSVSKFHVDRTAGTPKEQKYHIFRHPDNFSVPILGVKKTESDLNTLLNNTIPVISSEFPESSKYRWFELMTYVKGDLNSTLDFSSMANSLEVRAPFLDHDLVEVALSVDENRHISKKYGRKHFLKTILENEGVPSTIWDREKLGFSLITSYKESIDDLKSKAVDELTKLGFLNIHCDKFEKGRDREYLKTSAFGFYCWKQVWMDSGIVKL
jgi:asparagine synthase (glutamine-hydrolysing)